jgi:2-(1,2-epoxy-1,2-dihydrophenyl)acetyl-CoA isomerase
MAADERPHHDTGERPLDDIVRWQVEGTGIARLTIDRPDARNALTWAMRDRVSELLEAASIDVGVRAIVITGTGGAFCAGADLRLPQPPPPRPDDAPGRVAGEIATLVARGWQRLATSVLDCDKPVIAAVDGVAAGGGAQLALACDLVIASDRARFVQVFIDRGIVPDAGAAYIVTRLVGPQRAKELFFLGDSVDAQQALQLGLVNRVVPVDAFATVVDELAARLAAKPTRAIAMTKSLVNRALESDRITALRDEAIGQEVVQATEDAREGVRAFVERREPNFRGW